MNSFPEREISPLVDLPCPCSGLAALHVRSHLTLKMTYDGKKKKKQEVLSTGSDLILHLSFVLPTSTLLNFISATT